MGATVEVVVVGQDGKGLADELAAYGARSPPTVHPVQTG